MSNYLKIEIFLKIEMSSYLKIEIREAKLSQSRYLQSNPGKYDTLTVEVQEVATVSCGGVRACVADSRVSVARKCILFATM